MDIDLTEEQRQVRDLCREFAAQELAPHARRWDEHHEFQAAAVRWTPRPTGRKRRCRRPPPAS